MDKKVVVRFAPSPTGYLHIGGARTAIFNWLYARKHNGKFILRIEDTDAERSTEESIKGIMSGLEWLGIQWDEGPFFQTGFIKDHKKAAEQLLENGHAYKCFCTKEELDRKRETAQKNKTTYQYDGTCRNMTQDKAAEKEKEGIPYIVRLKVPKGDGCVSFNDIVYGNIEKKYRDIEDFVIVRSNNMPLYVFSNTVDDIRDKVSHVIRGQDHLANTPKQILIYKALNQPIPEFAHMSLTLDPKKAKISKRKHGEHVAVHFYEKNGFLPWAFVNFLVLLGWATKESREIFTEDELIDTFSLEGISRANSIFNIKKEDDRFFNDPKALNINSHYLRTLSVEDIFPFIKKQLEKEGIWDNAYENEKRGWFTKTVDLIRSRYQLITDFTSLGRAFFSDDYPIDPKALEKNIRKNPEVKIWLPKLADQIESMEVFSAETLEELLKSLIEKSGIKPGVLVNAVRTVTTGQAVGPGFFEVLLILGQAALVKRLKEADRLF